jgi:FPC/CPF motif-containing protein YcgG
VKKLEGFFFSCEEIQTSLVEEMRRFFFFFVLFFSMPERYPSMKVSGRTGRKALRSQIPTYLG